MSGILYGIGVGPGDPELLTIKAVRTIKACDVLILPSEPKEDCYAYQIVLQMIPEIEKKEFLCRQFPMTRDKKKLKEAHDTIYSEIAAYLLQDKKVGFLTIGDPSLYATFGYMQQRAVQNQVKTEVIAGVPSICAVMARLQIPFGESTDEIHIIPGSADIKASLDYCGTKIYMKSGKQLLELKSLLQNRKSDFAVWAVANCGYENEKVMEGIDELQENSGYLTIVIVKSTSV